MYWSFILSHYSLVCEDNEIFQYVSIFELGKTDIYWGPRMCHVFCRKYFLHCKYIEGRPWVSHIYYNQHRESKWLIKVYSYLISEYVFFRLEFHSSIKIYCSPFAEEACSKSVSGIYLAWRNIPIYGKRWEHRLWRLAIGVEIPSAPFVSIFSSVK